MPSKEKIFQVENLAESFKGSSSLAVTDYAGLTVEKMNNLRRELRERDIKYLVAKNTLLRLAAKDAGAEELAPHLVGPTAIAFGGEDPGVLAKVLHDFGKQNEKPQIRAMYIDGVLYQEQDVERIAKLPAKERLYAMLIGNIEAPLIELVRTLNGVIRDLIGVVEAIKESKSS